MAEPNTHRALPGAVDPEATWQVQDGNGVNVIKNRRGDNVLTAPVLLTDPARRQRAEALARAKWTPQRWKGVREDVPPEVLDAVEGIRTRRLANLAGVDHSTFDAPTLTLPAGVPVDQLAAALTPLQLGTLLAGSMGTGDYPVARALVEAIGNAPLAGLIETVAGRAAREARKRRGRSIPAASAIRAAEVLVDGLGGIDPSDADQVEAAETAERLEDLIEEGHFEEGDDAPRWGRMSIENPPRRIPLKPKLRGGRTRVASRRGTVPVRPWRADSDGCEYRRVVPMTAGGAVLVDLSGSMSLTPDDVEGFMAALPGAIVAGYRGDGRDGRLIVFAKDGKRCESSLIHCNGGNDVDLPALVWLGSQPGPRFWISDGYVVPGRGGSHVLAARQCADECRRSSIRRLESAEALAVRLSPRGDVLGMTGDGSPLPYE